jgi:hypothetical protein
VFDGSDLYPDLRNYMTNSVISGGSYKFRVKAKYQNGYTSYSDESLEVWACAPPSELGSPVKTAVTRTSISFEWS